MTYEPPERRDDARPAQEVAKATDTLYELIPVAAIERTWATNELLTRHVSIELEFAFLGELLTRSDLVDAIPDDFDADCFSQPYNTETYLAIRECRLATPSGGRAAVVDVAVMLNADKARKTYLAHLLTHAVGTLKAMVPARCKALMDLHRSRQIIDLCEDIRADLAAPSPPDPIGAIGKLANRIEAIGGGMETSSTSYSLDGAIAAAMRKTERAMNGEPPDGVLTGMITVDNAIVSMERKTVSVLAGRPGMGKAQPLDVAILMRDGCWSTMGDVKVGDDLASIDGAASSVAAVYPQGDRDVYVVTMSDGRTTRVCGEHLWRVMYREWDSPRIIDTDELRRLLGFKRYQKRLSIDVVSGDFGQADLPLDPYVLGVLLGDGGFTNGTIGLTTPDHEIVAEVQDRLGGSTLVRKTSGAYQYSLSTNNAPNPVMEPGARLPRRVHVLRKAIESFGLLGLKSEHKFIPPIYMHASRQQRTDLLCGLMDTDGWVEVHGSVLFSSASLALAEGVQALVRSLGGLCSIKAKRAFYRYKGKRIEGLTAWVCRIRHPHAEMFFLLERKRKRAFRGKNATVNLNVVSVEPAGKAECRCIAVTHPSHLYVTDGYTVTHNTALGLQWTLNAAEVAYRNGTPGVGMFSHEMSAEQLALRLLSVKSGIPLRQILLGLVSAQEHATLLAAEREMRGWPMTIEDGGGLSVSAMTLKARQMRRKHGLSLVVIDHLHIVPPEKGEGRSGPTDAITQVSMAVKRFAKAFDIPVLLLAQLSRGPEAREDKRPTMADLRQSGGIEQDADNIMLLFREEYYLPKTPPEKKDDESGDLFQHKLDAYYNEKRRCAGKADLILEKVRQGAPGTIKLLFDGQTTSFKEPGYGD